uniref:Uncharacterized protein n=1 Tax=Ciona savignyi TaxID=51511 RepID=H2YTN4_CIOSA
MPLESAAVTQTINLATSAPDSLDKQTAEHLQPDRPGSSGTPEPFAAPKHLEVPLIDDPDSDASSTATDGENGEVKDARQTTSASDSSTTDENHKPSEHEEKPTSTAESMAPGKTPVTTNGSNQVIEVDGEMVVIQEPEFDYYKFQPNKDMWSAPQFKKFVEIYNFPSNMSDIDVTQQLSHYRGLRLARVDPTHALCTLPTDNMAAELASQNFPAFETRPLSDASKQTKAKAKAKLENEKFEEIRSQRPKTNNSVAKRMIAGSLGQSSRSSAKRTSKK